ncbi:MAG: trimethylamine methyltransferase family protein [Desulfosarcinaceae bacterium]|nr:trimethylamine methyltransferase family protein [Desulfosarcinaceae bacterium]
MADVGQYLDGEEITRIHDASMEILSRVGVVFDEPEVLARFDREGFTVAGKVVFIGEAQVHRALRTAPAQFTITARRQENSVVVGGEKPLFAPGYGAPFIACPDGSQRNATLADYDNFCRLVQSSTAMDVNGFMMVVPGDLPTTTAHLDMLFSSMRLCDKPFMGCPISRQGARDTTEMAARLWGGRTELIEAGPVSVSLISSQSPLQFHSDMAGALVELAQAGQACVIDSLVMAGTSGPVTLAGVLALQNAEILAGVVLAQLIHPGAPVIYGGLSSAMDMRSGGLSVGCPELSQAVSASAQMARLYGLPCRSGGSLTDAHVADAQSAVEAALSLSTAVHSGVDFILDAAGIVSAYMAMSFEKFLIDEEMCGLLRKLTAPIDISADTIDLDAIADVGIGGQYLTQPKTLQRCRTEFYQTELFGRQNHAGWAADGARRIDQKATQMLDARLAAYEAPAIDPAIEASLREYVDARKAGR